MNTHKKPKYRYTVIGVDLAISKKQTADYTAIVVAKVYGEFENRRILICPYPINERLSSLETRQRILELHDDLIKNKHHVRSIYIEDVGYQGSLVEDLRRIHQLPVEGIKPIGDKEARLKATVHLIQDGCIRFPANGAENLIRQLTGFGSEKHDDLVDAFSLVILQIIEDRSGPLHVTTGDIYNINDPWITWEERQRRLEAKYKELHRRQNEGLL